MSDHGFSVPARTIPREKTQLDSAVSTHQLVSVVPDAPGTAYNRGKFLDERKMKKQQRADYLDQPGARAEAIPLRGDRT